MFGKFLKNYGKNAFRELATNLNDAIVRFDPEGASEAEIQTMEENFDEVNREFSKAKQEWQQEQREADEIVALRDKRMAAAEHIANQLESDPENAQMNDALNQLVESLENMQDDIDREVEEAQDAKEVMEELDATVKLYAEKLKTARTDMKRAMSAMEKAKRQEERAEAKADRAARLAGLKKDTSSLGSALSSMNKQAEEAKARADAASRKADLLGPSSVEENSAVAEAMAAVSGEVTPKASARDRLAALRK